MNPHTMKAAPEGPGFLARWMMRATVPLARRLSARRLAAGRPRSVWGVTPIVTIVKKAEADRRLGFQSETLVFTTYYITQNFDLNLRYIIGAARRIGNECLALTEILILCWAALRYDVFHYFFDRGILQPNGTDGIRLEELDFLRSCGARVYGFAYGADVRTRAITLELGRWNFCVDCATPGRFCRCDDAKGEHDMREMTSRLTASIALGDMLVYIPGVRSMHYWTVDADKFQPAADLAPAKKVAPLRIAHAPNHTHFKGTRYLEAAIEALRAEGHEIDYVKIQGVPNTSVIELFLSVDIVADQLIGGAYGFTALEAMALGKPVLTYVRWPELVDAPEECPLLQATPDTVKDVLRWCLLNRESLAAIGRQGRSYVRRWHCVEAVSARFSRLYRETGGFPPALVARWVDHEAAESARRESIGIETGWDHPFTVPKVHQISGRGCDAFA